MSSGSTIESTGNRRGSPRRSFSSLSSQDRTPPASTSEPVPAVVVTQTSGSGSLGIGRPSAVPPFTKSQMSPGHSLPSASVCGLAATAQMPLLPSMTEPPPSARTKSQPWARAIQPPALTVSRRDWAQCDRTAHAPRRRVRARLHASQVSKALDRVAAGRNDERFGAGQLLRAQPRPTCPRQTAPWSVRKTNNRSYAISLLIYASRCRHYSDRRERPCRPQNAISAAITDVCQIKPAKINLSLFGRQNNP